MILYRESTEIGRGAGKKSGGLPAGPNLSVNAIIPKDFIFAYKAKSPLLQHMLTSGIFPDGIRKDRGHAQHVKDKPKRQTLCLRSVALPFYRIVLQVNA